MLCKEMCLIFNWSNNFDLGSAKRAFTGCLLHLPELVEALLVINMHGGASEAPHSVVLFEANQANGALCVLQLTLELVLSHVSLERLPVLAPEFVLWIILFRWLTVLHAFLQLSHKQLILVKFFVQA